MMPSLQPEWFLSQVLAWIKDHTPFLEERIQPLMEGVVFSGRTVDVRVGDYCYCKCFFCCCVHVCSGVCVYVHVCGVYILVCASLILYILSCVLTVGGIHPMFAAGSRQQIAT